MTLEHLENIASNFLKFIKEGWFWILVPTLIALTLIILLILFGNPYQEGALHAKFILLYSLFKTYW